MLAVLLGPVARKFYKSTPIALSTAHISLAIGKGKKVTYTSKLHRVMPSDGGNITTQSVLTQGEIPEEGRKKIHEKQYRENIFG